MIVGDTTVDKAIDAVGAHLPAPCPRAEPPTPVPARPSARSASPAANAQPVLFTHKGRADQAIGYVAWPTTDLWANPQQALETDVLGEVMGLRLIDELRSNQGATYSPSVNYTHSPTWTGWGYLAASVEVPPAKLDGFFRDVAKIADDLRTKPVSADELDRAKKPRVRQDTEKSPRSPTEVLAGASSPAPRPTHASWTSSATSCPAPSASPSPTCSTPPSWSSRTTRPSGWRCSRRAQRRTPPEAIADTEATEPARAMRLRAFVGPSAAEQSQTARIGAPDSTVTLDPRSGTGNSGDHSQCRFQLGDRAPVIVLGATAAGRFFSLDGQAGRPALIVALGALEPKAPAQILERR